MRRHRHGRGHLHGARAAASSATSTTTNRAASARRAARAPAGWRICSPGWRRAARGAQDVDLLVRVSDNMMGNTVCVLADAAAMPVISFVNKFRSEFEEHLRVRRLPAAARRPRRPPPAAPPTPELMPTLEIDGQSVTVEDGLNVIQAAEQHRHRDPALLLPPGADHRRQLPHVPGRDREGAEAADRLQHPRRRGHGRAHADRAGEERARRGARVSAASTTRSTARSAIRPASASCRTTTWTTTGSRAASRSSTRSRSTRRSTSGRSSCSIRSAASCARAARASSRR